MKQIFIIFFFLQMGLVMLAQPTIVITGCPSGCNTCVEPSTALSYTATVTLGQMDTFVNVDWPNIVGGSGTSNTGTIFITWENIPNTNNAHSLQARLFYKNNGLKSVLSPVLNVCVKYLGSITQLNFNNSGSNTLLSNGGSVQLACGQQALNLSIPTPATDPVSSIIYTWQFSWGTLTTSTPSVSTTSNAGQSDVSVTVRAKRTDGTLVQNFDFNITRPRVSTPTMTGIPSTNICYNSSASLYTDAANVTTYNWTSTGALDITYSYNWLYALIKAKSFGSSGTVTLTVDNACQSPKSVTGTIYVGGPVITSATVDGQPLAVPNYINNPGLLRIEVNNDAGSTTDWTILNGAGNIYYAGQNQVSVYAYPFMRVEGVTSNQCGVGEARTFYVQDVSGGYYRMASPNPADNSVSAEVLVMNALKKATLVSDAHAGIVRTFNPANAANTNTQRNNNTFSFDVAQLPRGKYYLNFTFEGNKTFSEQIVLR